MIFSVTVTFNPESSFYENISSYYDCVDKCIIVDNSPGCSAVDGIYDYDFDFDKIIIIRNLSNLGIAEALNIGVSRAILEGAEKVLTMDQDSCFEVMHASLLIEKSNELDENVLLSASHVLNHLVSLGRYGAVDRQLREVKEVMASGNIFDVSLFELVGGFDSSLFIDFVDIDFCQRVRKKGGQILVDSGVVLRHELGVSKTFNFFKKRYSFSYHKGIRNYYFSRNCILVYCKNKDMVLFHFSQYFSRLAKIIICFNYYDLKLFVSGTLNALWKK